MTPPHPQFNKLWLQLNLKEVWEPTSPHGYSLDPQGPQPLAALRDLGLTVTQPEHDAAATATVGTNAPDGDHACSAAATDTVSTNAAAIAVTRGGRPAAVVPPMGTVASVTSVTGSAAAKSAEAKK